MKKQLLSGLGIVIASAALVALVYAQNDDSSHGMQFMNEGNISHPMMVNINPNGRAQIRGILVSSTFTTGNVGTSTNITGTTTATTTATTTTATSTTISTGSLVINVFGINFTVNITNAGGNLSNYLAQFKVGDSVGARGTITPGNALIINAKNATDWNVMQHLKDLRKDWKKNHNKDKDQNENGQGMSSTTMPHFQNRGESDNNNNNFNSSGNGNRGRGDHN